MGELPTNLKLTFWLPFPFFPPLWSHCSLQLERKWFWIEEQKPLKFRPTGSCPQLCNDGEGLEELQQGQAEGPGHFSCSVPPQQLHENQQLCLTPSRAIHLCKKKKNRKAKSSHSESGCTSNPACRKQRRCCKWKPFVNPVCVFTGALLDKACPEMLGMALLTLCRQSRGDKVGFLAGEEHCSKGYPRSSSVGFGSNSPAGTLKTSFELQSVC